MLYLEELQLWNFRLFKQQVLNFNSKANIIIGGNSSGKTSIIESIWLLSRGRSFRSNQLQTLHRNNEHLSGITIKLLANDQSSTISWRHTAEQTHLKLNKTKSVSQNEVASLLPCLLISPEQHRWLLHQPQSRRKILDWCLYYLQPKFQQQWLEYKKNLAQRNHALQQSLPQQQTNIWNEQLSSLGERITSARETMATNLANELNQVIKILLPQLVDKAECNLYSGWSKKESLIESLEKNYNLDSRYGFTKSGPHRADLKLKVNQLSWEQKLSRGEQKLFAICIYLSMASIFAEAKKSWPIIMIDDLLSELDQVNQKRILSYLEHHDGQVIITLLKSKNRNQYPGAKLLNI